jgi:hypothetical protein
MSKSTMKLSTECFSEALARESDSRLLEQTELEIAQLDDLLVHARCNRFPECSSPAAPSHPAKLRLQAKYSPCASVPPATPQRWSAQRHTTGEYSGWLNCAEQKDVVK